MKILQLGKFFPIRGGVEKVMYDLMCGLSADKIYCDMLCASTEAYPAGEIQLNPYAKLIVVPTQLKLSATMLTTKMLPVLRNIQHQYDIIHIHHPDPMACLALRLSGYEGKVVLHWHSDILRQKALLQLYKPLQRWLIQRADVIVGTTPIYVEESPFLQKVQHKIDFIPIGVTPMQADLEKIKVLRKKYSGKKVFFSLGRLVEYKGYVHLIKSARNVPLDTHIVIGGKGPLYGELKQLIEEEDLTDRVSLLGYMDDDEVAAYFAISHAFVLSSIWKTEAFAIVQIEAMSCHKPVISTAIPGSGVSWVNAHFESGLVVPVGDDKQLAMAIGLLAEDEAIYTKLASGAHQRYQALFTTENMISQSRSVYERV